MNRIVASITSLQQHLDLLANNPIIYRPRVCPHCSFGQLWCHGRGRNTSCPVPPAQIPASATNALGSSLEYERQSGNKGVDVVIELWERNAK